MCVRVRVFLEYSGLAEVRFNLETVGDYDSYLYIYLKIHQTIATTSSKPRQQNYSLNQLEPCRQAALKLTDEAFDKMPREQIT